MTTTRTHFRPAHESARSAPLSWKGEFPDDLLREAVRRLRVVALVYAVVFFLASPLTSLLNPDPDDAFFASFGSWGSATISIIMALLVVVLTSSRRISPRALMSVGLVFEVVGSFGIAMSEYWGALAGVEVLLPEHTDVVGLSFVAPWIILFTVVVPAARWKALLAATCSGSMVLVAIWLSTLHGGTPAIPVENFVGLGSGYVMVVAMAYIGGRVVFGLGRAVRQAREMGSYRLTELLGRGGMGEVWKARHRLLARPAAIKLIRPEMLGTGDVLERAKVVKRFEREAQSTASMRSPHTIELYDFGVTPEGTFYYVMELLDGYDLETMIQKFGPISPARAIHLLGQVCHSLAEAHDSGLIHRDIKPANVYVCRYGREVDFVKVLDFGLAKLVESGIEDDIDASITAGDVTCGTPAFIAPEQATSDGTIDGRSDLYAIGCLAYWLVTGQVVFEGSSALKMIIDHMNTPPIPPSLRAEQDIPEALERVILSCLEKDPDRRPQTAEELRAALDECDACDPWTAEHARSWWQDHGPELAASPPAIEIPSTRTLRVGAISDTVEKLDLQEK